MFDPTAFDNLKTVMEGAFYDRDLDGRITILDRNDLLNSSKLSREFSITFSLSNQQNARMTFSLQANLANLAAELLPKVMNEKEIGCYMAIHLVVCHRNEKNVFLSLEEMLKRIWGNERKIKQEIRLNPFSMDNKLENHLTILFNRIITEEQIDDLVMMVDYMEATLQQIIKNKEMLSIT
ncbi:hypothetical protein [Niallia sp. 01092]|uniref:hypothetical protein n=1 Tax=unclassified Niallia TaxID=2837522 RepID=UPI003FD5C2A8